ncbi:MAG: S-layer homology domain-containing protein, partial [Chloroflexi bacterium]|nr:S-layer homology domain-containing protein [Chloroflexota bacterium]
ATLPAGTTAYSDNDYGVGLPNGTYCYRVKAMNQGGDSAFSATALTGACFTLTTAVFPTMGGALTPSPAPNCGGSQYASGTVVQLSAVPAAGYAFDHWSGDASGGANPLTVTMSADKTITGNFVTSPATTFLDVSTAYWAYQWVEALAGSGITSGCSGSPPLYCPEDNVNRAQMAIFLLRGTHGADYQPPPATGLVFSDVPINYWAAAWIEQLAREGITSGCAPGTGDPPGLPYYCPESSVTRAQMSIFLLRAEHGSGYAPPAATGTMFSDVPINYWAAAWIEQLAAEGITSGCAPGTGDPPGLPYYCPESSVTRAQMAVFLTRTFNLSFGPDLTGL